MPDSTAGALKVALTGPLLFGQILIRKTNDAFILAHRADENRRDLQTLRNVEDAIEISRSLMTLGIIAL